MNASEREQLRRSLVRFLVPSASLRKFGVPTELLLQQSKAEGRPDLTALIVESELAYLVDKGLVELTGKAISPENRSWRITAEGRDWAAMEGLE